MAWVYSAHFIVNYHNVVLFPLLTFPEILPHSLLIRLCHKCMDLHPWQFVIS